MRWSDSETHKKLDKNCTLKSKNCVQIRNGKYLGTHQIPWTVDWQAGMVHLDPLKVNSMHINKQKNHV